MPKSGMRIAVACAVVLAFVLGGAAQVSAPSAVSGASPASSWSIDLSGAREDAIKDGYYEKLFNQGAVEKVVDKKGVKTTYRGVPLSRIVAIVDGTDSAHPYAFAEELWRSGYDITLVASDGYAATFSTKDLAPDALIVAVWENGVWIAPMTVGDSAKSLWVKGLVAIETSLAPVAAATESFSLELEVNGAKAAYDIDELASSELFMRGPGSYTTSAGTTYTAVYGGVGLRGLLERYAKLTAKDSVTFVALDGYEMTYSGSSVLDESDGTWILAFEMDGERIPKDPGYVRTIKIGPSTPNIDGHLSVRMVKKIVVKQADFRDFALKLEGKASWTLDRSTIQSCVSCHKKTVAFEQKGKASTYTGFPLWLALGYVDDPAYAPHKQGKSIAPYDDKAAKAGYKVKIAASDGFSVTLDSREIGRVDDVILAMYKNDEELPKEEFPLVLAWDKGIKALPAGIKAIKMISGIAATF
jgi:hypothetical protein